MTRLRELILEGHHIWYKGGKQLLQSATTLELLSLHRWDEHGENSVISGFHDEVASVLTVFTALRHLSLYLGADPRIS